MERSYRVTLAIFAAFLAWFAILAAMNIAFGVLGLGSLLLLSGVWLMFSAKPIYEHARKEYKKLPKGKQKSWNKPTPAYYYFNLFVIVPAMITIGILCFYMAWFVA